MWSLDHDRLHRGRILSAVSATGDLVSRLSAVYTGALTDVLDRHGYRQQTLAADIPPAAPGHAASGSRIPRCSGVRIPTTTTTRRSGRSSKCWARCRPESVAVYETKDRAAAHLGELSVTSLASRGCAGAVIDGGVRDAEYILREDFPVFSRYVTPQDCVVRWELMAHGDVTIVVGGVEVSPGDWIAGDRDGRVIIPGERLEEILAEAEEKVATESEIRSSVRDGMLPLEAYERYGTF